VTHTIATATHALEVLGEDDAWRLLQALALRATRGQPVLDGAIALDEQGELRVNAPGQNAIYVRPECEACWAPLLAVDDQARMLLDLFVPLCAGPGCGALVVAHLGQSLDGRLATVTGASRFVTGPEDLRHMHRLRALFDAVVIGAQTACIDDPELTTRLVTGRQPVRVVLDPHGRMDDKLRLLCDGRAPTLVVTGRGDHVRSRSFGSHVEVVEVATDDRQLNLHDVLAELGARGLRRVFVEGGGVTVSRFLQAGLLDRLHLAIAPKILGSGTHALRLQPIEHMSEAITTRCRRFALGDDMLFDCDLRA
jgi:diaminohydroxyphosphoribosylaminopyrimidine deaminase/5-amino-6-(5-phosphoribosylamino)uracil reductase